MIIDTHLHLYDEKYEGSVDEIIKEAFANNVTKMIIIGYDKETSYKAVAMANKYPFMYASVGLHPSEVQKENEDVIWIEELVKDPRVVAIGEIGLDYYWDKTYIDLQKQYFIKQIKIANKYNLPIIVHSRSSIQDTFDILKANKAYGVLHCFPGSKEMALGFIKLGFLLGIGGVVTFKNSKDLKEVVKEIPLKYLLSETDGPYLAPEPFRGKVNKPEYLPYIINKIASIKEIDPKIVCQQLKDNAEKLFKI